MNPLATVMSCLCGSGNDYHPLSDPAPSARPRVTLTGRPRRPHHLTPGAKKAVADVLSILRNAEDWHTATSRAELARQVDDVVSAQGGWTEWIAESVLDGIKAIFEQAPEKIGSAMLAARDRADDAASSVFHFQFARDHPEVVAGLVTIVAIGVLVMLAPVIVEALGFAEWGTVEGV